jgi:hypothetical protein
VTPTTATVALPLALELLFYRGDDVTVTFTAGPSITGSTLAAQVYDAYGNVLAAMTVTAAGQAVTAKLAGALSAGVPAAGARWDCRATSAAGTVTTLAAGRVRTRP